MKVLSSIIRLSLVVSAALADSRPDEQQMKMLLQSLSFPKTASKVTIPTAKTFNASAVKASKNAEFLKGASLVQMSSFVSSTSFHKARALEDSDSNQCVSDLTAILTDPTSPLNTLVLLASLGDLSDENLNCGVRESTIVCDGAGTLFDENFEGICSAELSGKVIETEVVIKNCPEEYYILVQTVPVCLPPSCDEDTAYAFFNFVLSQLPEGEERNLKEDFHTERLLDEDEECTPVMYMAPLGTYEPPAGDKATQCFMNVGEMLDDATSPLNPFVLLEDFDDFVQYCQYEEGSPPVLDCDLKDVYSPDFSSLCIEAFGAGSRTKDIEYHVIPTSESDETTPATLLRNIPFCMPPSCEVAMVFYLLNGGISEDEIDVSVKFEGTGGMECLKGTFDNYGIDISLDFEEGPQFDIVEENALTPYSPDQLLSEDNYEAFCESNYLSDEKVEELCDASVFDIEADCESVGGRYKEVDMFFSYQTVTTSGDSIEVDVETRNLPLCVDKSCRKSELVKFVTLLYENDIQQDIDFIRSPIDQCTEKKSDLFNLKFKNDKMRRKNCNFLGNMKNLNRKKKLCGKPNGPRGSEAPRDSCPATCCRCAEYPMNRFVMKKMQGKPVTRTCKWLSDQSEEDIDLYCGKVNIGSATHGPAYSACPYTCGICEA